MPRKLLFVIFSTLFLIAIVSSQVWAQGANGDPQSGVFGERTFRKWGQMNGNLVNTPFFKIKYLLWFIVNILNLFDRRNEKKVLKGYQTWGHTFNIFSTREARVLNTLEDFFLWSDFFSEPCRIQLGFRVGFNRNLVYDKLNKGWRI